MSDAPSIAKNPEVGDWIVLRFYGVRFVAVGPVTRVTAQQVQHPDRWTQSRTARTPLRNVLWSGPESAAQRLASQLESSAALAEQERQASTKRHLERQAKLIAAASGKSLDGSSPQTQGPS